MPVRRTRPAWPLLLTALGGALPAAADEPQGVAASVRSFMAEVAHEVTRSGPTAWQRYCADTPAFFMAVNGRLQFADGAAARAAIAALPATIKHIELRWGTDLRVDPLSADYAVVASSFTELLVNPQGQRHTEHGFFTGVVERGATGWKLRDAHWSSAPAGGGH